jgi:hypothetical protein
MATLPVTGAMKGQAMPNSPTTFRGEPADRGTPGWDRPASLHRSGDGGVLSPFRTIRSGTLAQLVRYVAGLPEAERSRYEIVKEGDHRLHLAEIMALAGRSDFPGSS